MLKLSVVSDSETFQSLREQWHALWARLDQPHLFYSFDWCWSAWKIVAEPRGFKLRLVTGRLDGRLVLIWPLMTDHRVLRMLSSETLEYRDIIVAPSEHSALWIDEAWSHVLKTVRTDAFIFQNLRSPSPLGRKMARLPAARPVGGGWCPVVRLDQFADWDAYAARLPRSLRSDQRRQWKRLEQALPGCAFTLADRSDMIAPVMDWIGRHKVTWGEAKGKPAIWFEAGDIRALLQAVADLQLREGKLVLATLADGETIISAGLGYVCGGEFLFHAFAYDAAYGTYSPSRLLLERLLRWCFLNGVRTFDFMPGEEAYKRIWATDYVRTESYMGALTWRGSAYVRLSGLTRTDRHTFPAIRQLYGVLPRGIRDFVQRRLRAFQLVKGALSLDLAPTRPPQASAESKPPE